MTESVVSYVSAVLASILFLFFHYGLVFPARSPEMNMLFSLTLALAAYAGFLLMLPRAKSLEEELAGLDSFAGADAGDAAMLIRSTKEKIDAIRLHGSGLVENSKLQVERIADIAEAIVEGFKEDPSDIGRSRQFLFHYLDATLDIIEKYRELADKNAGPQIAAVLKKSEQTLSDIEGVFQKQYQRNLTNEAMELDVNLDVLKNMIKSEGL
jgi:hypothetical protein